MLIAIGLAVYLNDTGDNDDFDLSSEEGLPETVRIGVISPTDGDLPKYEFVVRQAELDINRHLNEIGSATRFEFLLSSGVGMAARALEIVQSLHQGGVDLVVGGGWSSQLCTMESYSNINGIVVVSPSSSSPSEHLTQSDNLFRLCPHDWKYGEDIANIAYDYGLRAVVILERDDTWGEGVADWFVERFEELGGEVLGQIKYLCEQKQGFNEYLRGAEQLIQESLPHYTNDEVGVLLVCFREGSTILKEASTRDIIMNITWFGTDSTANVEWIIEEVAPEVAKVKLFSPLPLPVGSGTTNLTLSYLEEFEESLDFYVANIYDASWVLALSVLEAGTVDGVKVAEVLPAIAASYEGLTGLCRLDFHGDRSSYTLGIFACSLDGELRWVLAGYYYSEEKLVRWVEGYDR